LIESNTQGVKLSTVQMQMFISHVAQKKGTRK
jgi:hypothetical protein